MDLQKRQTVFYEIICPSIQVYLCVARDGTIELMNEGSGQRVKVTFSNKKRKLILNFLLSPVTGMNLLLIPFIHHFLHICKATLGQVFRIIFRGSPQ